MATPLTLTVIPGYLPPDGQPVTPANLRLIALPAISLVGQFSTTTIADGAVNENKLNASVAGAGLTGGGGVKLAVVPDNVTLDINGGTQAVEVKDGGITLGKCNLPFQGATPYSRGIPGLLPEPQPGDQAKYLRADGKWIDIIAAATAAAAAQGAATFNIYSALNFC